MERRRDLQVALVPGAAHQTHVTGLALRGKRRRPLALVACHPVGVHGKARQVADRGLGRLLAAAARLLFKPDRDLATVALGGGAHDLFTV